MDVLIDRFELWGCNVFAFEHGDAARAGVQALARPPDVIISDYRLPGEFNGVQAINRLRTLLKQQIPGIVLTGDAHSTVVTEVQESDQVLILKPAKTSAIKTAIERLVPRMRP